MKKALKFIFILLFINISYSCVDDENDLIEESLESKMQTNESKIFSTEIPMNGTSVMNAGGTEFTVIGYCSPLDEVCNGDAGGHRYLEDGFVKTGNCNSGNISGVMTTTGTFGVNYVVNYSKTNNSYSINHSLTFVSYGFEITSTTYQAKSAYYLNGQIYVTATGSFTYKVRNMGNSGDTFGSQKQYFSYTRNIVICD